jgi:hypothetical protein
MWCRQGTGDGGGARLRPASGASCRRGFLALAGGMLMTAGWARGAHAEAVPDNIRFRVLRAGSDIGRHEFRFAPTPDGFTVDSQVELAVKIAFITAFYYVQRGRDVWVGDNLVASDVVTDDDGERTRLEARREGDALRVEGARGEIWAPLGTMNDISFWNESIVAARQLIDSKIGTIDPIRTNGRMSERIVVRGEEIAAVGYAIESSRGRSGRIWYDQGGNWVKARLLTRGETLDYELV